MNLSHKSCASTSCRLASGSNKRKTLSQEEIDIRRREDALFAEIENPPNVFDTASQLATETTVKSDSGEGSTANEEQDSSESKRAYQ
jgi:hypothetical protein